MPDFTRRLLVAALPLALTGCLFADPGRPVFLRRPAYDPYAPWEGGYGDVEGYGEIEDRGNLVPAVDEAEIDPAFLRREVAYAGREAAGTIIVDPGRRYLFLVESGGRATRYGVGVGREGFGWSGVASIRRKSEWPRWTPPPQMIARQPEVGRYAGGMPGGIDNPLGARAMYLYQGDRDTLFRIHGTNEPDSIGKRVSSGCIRLINQDVIDLYRRVPVGTKVVVLANAES
jgi:lipoprotein-anchoring transpeptidase ErfK/SrfK